MSAIADAAVRPPAAGPAELSVPGVPVVVTAESTASRTTADRLVSRSPGAVASRCNTTPAPAGRRPRRPSHHRGPGEYLSPLRLTHAFEPILRDQPEPAITITTSGVALVPEVGNATDSATMAALHSLCLTMRYTLSRAGSRVQVSEVMAPLTDSPIAQHVTGPKAPPAQVAQAVLDRLEADDLKMHVGQTADVHPVYLRSPQEALELLNAALGR